MASTDDDTPGERLARAIRDGRARKGWTQDDLVAESGVSRPTILRYEKGDTSRPDPVTVRAVFMALGIDPREAAVVLGYVTRDEMGLPPEPPREFSQDIEDVIAILNDPDVSNADKARWIDYLKFIQAEQGRTATPRETPARPARRRAAG